MTPAADVWSVRTLMEWTTHYLDEKSIGHPRLNVEWLLCDTLQCKRLDLYVNHDRPLSRAELDAFKARLQRRLQHEPLQYIVGATEFMGLPLEVTRDVLIPRPDTETLVEHALDLLKTARRPVHIVDLGTGSGNVAIALAHFLNKKSVEFQVTCTDISEAALAVAARNARRNGVDDRVRFVCADFRTEEGLAAAGGTADVIVSNPPYISDCEFDLLAEEVRLFEPEAALRGGVDGLDAYRAILKAIPALLSPDRTFGTLFVETGYDQAGTVRELMAAAGGTDLAGFRDPGGHLRVVKGRFP